MSEFFASANVRVKPVSTGFRDELRTQIKKAITSAGVFKVPVKLEPLAFKKAIQDELRAATFVAKVTPNTAGFHDELLKKLSKTPIPIKVVPIIDKKALLAQAAGLTLDEGSAKKATAQKAATAADVRATKAANDLAAAELRVEEATRALAAARRDLAGATLADPAARQAAASRLIDLEQAKARAEAQHAALAPRRAAGAGSAEEVTAQKAVTAADKLATQAANDLAAANLRVEETALSLAAAEKALAEATSPVAKRMVGGGRLADLETAKLQAQAEHAAAVKAAEIAAASAVVPVSPAGGRSSSKTTTENVTRQMAAERGLKAVVDERTASEKKLATAEAMYAKAAKPGLDIDVRKEALGRARVATINAEDTATRDLANATAALTVTQKESLVTVEASSVALRAKIDKDIADIAAQEELAAAQAETTGVLNAANEALAINIKEITTRSELQRVDNKLTSIAADLQAQQAAAIEAKDTVLAGDIALLRKQIAAQDALVTSQRDGIKSSAKGAASLAQARRGVIATVASFAGLRGAVLAASQPFLIATIGVTALAKSLQQFAQFERELNTFQAVAGATADQMQRVTSVAKQLGADITLPSVSAADAAQAMTELAKAGLSVNDAIAGTRGVLQLATAAEIDNAAAAQLVASALNAFGLAGEKATHVADVFANAANAAQGSIADIGAAFQQSAAVARQAGISFEDTTALLTIFAQNGLRGSDAGTSLRTSMLRLIAPTKNASKFIQDLDLHIRDVNGHIRPDIFAQFGEATKNLPPALRDFIAETIAGQDAIRAFAIGAREGSRGLELVRLQLDQQGTAQEVAAARTKGLSGEFQALTSNLQTTATELGKFTSGPIKGAVTVVDNLTTGVGELLEALNKLAAGDFGGGFKDLGKDALKPVENAFDAGADAGKRFRSLFEGDDPFKGFKEGPKIIQDLGSALTFGLVPSAVGTKKKIADLADQLIRLQKLRVEEFQLRLPVEKTTRDIEKIRAKLKELNVLAPETIPLTPIDKALGEVRQLVSEIEEARKKKLKLDPGADVSDFNHQLALLQERLNTRLRLQVRVQTAEKDRNRFLEEIKSLRAKAAAGDEGAKLRIEIDQAQIDRDNALMRDLRKQILNTLQGIQGDAKKVLSSSDLADTFLLAFQGIALAPEQIAPELLGNIDDMIKKIGSHAKLAGPEGSKVGNAIAEAIQQAIDAAIKADDPKLAAILLAKGQKIAGLFKGATAAAFKNIKIPITAQDIADMFLTQDIAISSAEAFGTVQQQIKAHLAKLNAAEAKAKVKGPKRVTGQARRDLLNQITAEKNAIASLTQQETSKVETANNKADQAFLDSFSNREQELQNKLAGAAGTTSVADDIRFTKALRDLYAQEIKEAKTRIKDAQKRTETVLKLEGDLTRENSDLAELESKNLDQMFQGRIDTLNEALTAAQATPTLADDIRVTKALREVYKKQIAEARTQIKDAAARNAKIKSAKEIVRQLNRDLVDLNNQKEQRFRDSLQLDIDFANTKGDVSGEIKAREALIRELTKEQNALLKGLTAAQRAAKRRSNEWKELRNQIAAEKKSIDDLKKENDKKVDAMRTLAFSFLQTQQGFAANLLGNLIPLGATGGLVGNQSPASPQPPQPGAGFFPKQPNLAPTPTGTGGKVGPTQLELTDPRLVTDLTDALKETASAVTDLASGTRAGVTAARTAAAPQPPFKLNSPTDPGSLQDPSKKRLFALPGPNPGLLERGNLDLLHRPHVRNKDGSISSVHSASFGFSFDELPASVQKGLKDVKGKMNKQFEVLLPEVWQGLGRVATDAEALAHFRKTGENLGVFASAALADAYAGRLHRQQAALTSTAQNPNRALSQAAAANVAAGAVSGMTAAQAATLIKLMTDLVTAVKAQNVGSSHPEAKHGRQAQSAAWETQHQ